jgi:ceramide glucosyltransferase
MQLGVALAVLVVVVLLGGTTFALVRAMARHAALVPRSTLSALPPLLVIRPVRGHDAGLEANVEAALAQEYPGAMETIFVLDDDSDPAGPIIERAIAERGGDARVLFAGPLRRGRTGKLHAMMAGLAAAELEAPLVCFADSDTRPGPTLLGELASVVVARPSIGAAFARGVCSERAMTTWDVGHSMMLDALYGPQATLAMVSRGRLPFIMGQTVVLRRSALSDAGGLEASQGQLVDDMHIGRRIAAAGYENILCPQPVTLVQAGLSWQAFRSLAIRWITYSRTGIPFWPFNGPTIVFAGTYLFGLLGTALAWLVGAPAVAVAFAGCAVLAVLCIEGLRRLHGGGRAGLRALWAAPICLALLPVFFVRAHLARTVEWRGRRYSLDEAGCLARS